MRYKKEYIFKCLHCGKQIQINVDIRDLKSKQIITENTSQNQLYNFEFDIEMVKGS